MIVSPEVVALLSAVAWANLPDCLTLEGLYTPQPHYPEPEQVRSYLPGTSYNHVRVTGFVEVKFMVARTGRVKEVSVIASENTPNRNLSDLSFEGFLESSVLPTISNWRFSPVSEPCVSNRKFTYEFDPNL